MLIRSRSANRSGILHRLRSGTLSQLRRARVRRPRAPRQQVLAQVRTTSRHRHPHVRMWCGHRLPQRKADLRICIGKISPPQQRPLRKKGGGANLHRPFPLGAEVKPEVYGSSRSATRATSSAVFTSGPGNTTLSPTRISMPCSSARSCSSRSKCSSCVGEFEASFTSAPTR